MIEHPYEKWLDKVEKPSQYTGGEVHSVIKDRAQVDCRIALCFPELYSIGMAHLGLKILYSVVNKRQRLWAERFFAPKPDMEKILRDNSELGKGSGLKESSGLLRSLESHDPLINFDIAGFSITTELCYTGILSILELGGIPLKQKDRQGEKFPLVIGGGAAVYNPEPLADFFDLFILGEAEELLPHLMETFAEYKKSGLPKNKILRELANMKGVYVPSLFNVSYDGLAVKKIEPLEEGFPTPTRVFIEDLNSSPFPCDMVVPYGRPVFDRLAVEIDRGCTQACRFCQAGFTYRPVRERAPEKVLNIIEEGLKSTGFDEVSLASLSSGDYSNIEPLVKAVMDSTSGCMVSLSLPSLRSGTLTEGLIHQIRRVRKTGFTITAEAGSERLRNVINKKISETEIMETAEKVLAGGWRHLKLYFMTGLPTETDDDIFGIIDIVEKIRSLNIRGRRFQKINVGLAQFVPKPHTPFQWMAMESMDELSRKKATLHAAFKKMKNIFLKWHDVEMSYMESVFARGDRRLGAVILNAYEKGCRLDNWGEFFRFDKWLEAFEEERINPDDYALRERAKEETLPWDHLDIGVKKKYLLLEFSRSVKEKITEDCRFGNCAGCGIDPCNMVISKPIQMPVKPSEFSTGSSANPPGFRYRLGFRKEGLARYLSHLDMGVAVLRAVRRAELPIAYSQGIRPRVKLSLGDALPLGVISLCEMMDIELKESLAPELLLEKMSRELGAGFTVYSAVLLQPPYRSIQATVSSMFWEIADSPPGVMKPSLEEVKNALESMEKIKEAKLQCPPDGSFEKLLFESSPTGMLSGIKKLLPDFALSGNRRMTKISVVARGRL